MPQMFSSQLQNAGRAMINVLLHGKPGRGKSSLAAECAKAHVRSHGGIIRQFTLPEDTPSALLAGGFRPNASGSWDWTDGPVTAVYRQGGVLVMDELAHASPEAATFLLAALDGTPQITLPSGEVLTKAPVWVLATQNEDPDTLLPALLDRLPIRKEITMPENFSFLGKLSEAAKRDLECREDASLRPWVAMHSALNHGVKAAEIAPLLWPGRDVEIVEALKLAGAL